MVTQILNFGLPAPIDIQIVGPNHRPTGSSPRICSIDIKSVPGTADMRIQQPFDNPRLHGQRKPTHGSERWACSSATCAEPAGRHQRQLPDLADLLSRPSKWRGIQYRRAVAAVRARYAAGPAQCSAHASSGGANGAAGAATPPTAFPGAQVCRPRGPGRWAASPSRFSATSPPSIRAQEPAIVTHYNITPVIDIYGNVVGTDLASVSKGIQKIVDAAEVQRSARVAHRRAWAGADHAHFL